MKDEELAAARDGYSSRPSYLRAVGSTLLVVLMWSFGGPRGLIGVMAALAGVAWVHHLIARRRAASIGRNAS